MRFIADLEALAKRKAAAQTESEKRKARTLKWVIEIARLYQEGKSL